MVSTLPERPDLDQLRRRAKELRDSAEAGESHATERLAAYGPRRSTLAAAQLAIAREYGFASWTRLNVEVRRKRLIESGDVAGLRELLAQHPELATAQVSSALSGTSSSALEYVAVARFHGSLDGDVAGDLARTLLAAGARPDGPNRSGDTPLVTAASYGEVDMVRALLAAGADVEAVGGSIPGGGTALAHAVHYGMPEIVDLLVDAGAVVHGIVEAAGTGAIPDAMLRSASAHRPGRGTAGRDGLQPSRHHRPTAVGRGRPQRDDRRRQLSALGGVAGECRQYRAPARLRRRPDLARRRARSDARRVVSVSPRSAGGAGQSRLPA